MTMTTEWLDRFGRWRDELPRHFYRPLGVVEMTGFVTDAQLTPEEALSRDFEPMPTGTAWGAKWEYGWFKGEFVLPAEAAGERIALVVEPGGESVIFVNGTAAGAKDRRHKEIACRPQL